MVWREASYLPITVSIEEKITNTLEIVGGVLKKKSPTLAFSASSSALLLACHEARAVGLKRQALGFIYNACADLFCPVGHYSQAAFLKLYKLCCEQNLILALSWEGVFSGPFWKYIYNGMFWYNHLYGELPMVKRMAFYKGRLEDGDGL